MVVDLHCQGYSLREIAVQMSAARVPTPAGAQRPWLHTHVHRLLRTNLAKLLIAQHRADSKYVGSDSSVPVNLLGIQALVESSSRRSREGWDGLG